MASIKRDIIKDALEEKVKDVFFVLSDFRFNTESEASDFITSIRELIEEYNLPKDLLNKVCLLHSAECLYFLCMEEDKETVMEDTEYFGENIEFITTL